MSAPFDPDPLAPYRDRWNIQARRDDFLLVSAELQPTSHSLIYVVAYTGEELAKRLGEIEEGLAGGEER